MSDQHGFTAAENLDIRRYFGVMLDVLTDRDDPPPRNELKAAMFRALAEYDDLNDDALWRVADELDPPEPEPPAEPDWWSQPGRWWAVRGLWRRWCRGVPGR